MGQAECATDMESDAMAKQRAQKLSAGLQMMRRLAQQGEVQVRLANCHGREEVFNCAFVVSQGGCNSAKQTDGHVCLWNGGRCSAAHACNDSGTNAVLDVDGLVATAQPIVNTLRAEPTIQV